jgi:hypothetical protein
MYATIETMLADALIDAFSISTRMQLLWFGARIASITKTDAAHTVKYTMIQSIDRIIFVQMQKGDRMRLIDADALIKKYDLHIVIGAGDNICIDIADIAKAPTVDAVEVVRCKDCRFYSKYTVSCSFVTADANWYEDDFCSYGERTCHDKN